MSWEAVKQYRDRRRTAYYRFVLPDGRSPGNVSEQEDGRWKANGFSYLERFKSGHLIGYFDTRKEAEAAVLKYRADYEHERSDAS